MGSIATCSRSSSSMGSSATFVLVGWIDSWDQSSQLANYWRRYFHIPELSPEGNWHSHHHEAPESPVSVQESVQESRFNNWQPSSGTFSTMTGMPTWQYSNVLRIQMMTSHDIRFRSSRRETWLILPVIWQNLPVCCQNKPVAWRRSLMRPCEL